jgi:hypothetical protein
VSSNSDQAIRVWRALNVLAEVQLEALSRKRILEAEGIWLNLMLDLGGCWAAGCSSVDRPCRADAALSDGSDPVLGILPKST